MKKTTDLPDPDIRKVSEVLRAAKRGPRDPDDELAQMLSELAAPDSSLDAQEVLRELASDACSD